MPTALHIQLDQLASDRWARRGVRILIRSVGLGLSLVCVGLGASLLFDLPLPWQWLIAAGLACVAGGALLLLCPRMSARDVARRLDRHFRLNEQLATALELDAHPAGVEVYLQDKAQHTLSQIQGHTRARQSLPWSEIGLSLALLVVLGGLALLYGVGASVRLSDAEPLPPLAQPQPTTGSAQNQGRDPSGNQQSAGDESLATGVGDPLALQALADALRGQSITRQVAEALDQGDQAGAARQLRALADQAGQVSQQARNDLASALRDAADQLNGHNPDLAEQLRTSANHLQSGDDAQAAQALEDLASVVDGLGREQSAQSDAGQPSPDQPEASDTQAQAGGAGNGTLPGEQRAQPAQRLGVDGVPLELETQGDGSSPTTGQLTGDGGTGDGGDFAQGGSDLSTDPVQASDDPLRIPADLRDVVQDYFSP